MMDTIELKRDCEVITIPSGMRTVLPKGTALRIVQTRGNNYTVSSNIHALYRIDARDADALGVETPAAKQVDGQPGSLSEALVWQTLKTIYDPELPINIVDLGLIYSCAMTPNETGRYAVTIRMALTSPGCGMSNVLKADVEANILHLPEVAEVRVEIVFDPPWDQSRMSEAARLQLGIGSETAFSPRLTRIT